MAAEKLTKQRFAQIMMMMALLVAAFCYRTLTFEDSDNIQTCNIQKVCDVKVGDAGQTISIAYNIQQSQLEITAPDSLSISFDGQTLPMQPSLLRVISLNTFPIQLLVIEQDTELMRIKVIQ